MGQRELMTGAGALRARQHQGDGSAAVRKRMRSQKLTDDQADALKATTAERRAAGYLSGYVEEYAAHRQQMGDTTDCYVMSEATVLHLLREVVRMSGSARQEPPVVP